MTRTEFLLMLCVNVLVMGAAVEIGLRIRWKTIEAMFAKALMHGGSIDTLTRQLRADSRETRELAAGALQATVLLKDRVDAHERQISELRNHRLLRPLGGHGDLREGTP